VFSPFYEQQPSSTRITPNLAQYNVSASSEPEVFGGGSGTLGGLQLASGQSQAVVPNYAPNLTPTTPPVVSPTSLLSHMKNDDPSLTSTGHYQQTSRWKTVSDQRPSLLTPTSPEPLVQTHTFVHARTTSQLGPVSSRRPAQRNKGRNSRPSKTGKPGEHTIGWTVQDWKGAGAIEQPLNGIKPPGKRCLVCIWYSGACGDHDDLGEDGKCQHCAGPPLRVKKRRCIWLVPRMGIHSYPDARRVLGILGARSFKDAVVRDLQRIAASAATVVASPLRSVSPSLLSITSQSSATTPVIDAMTSTSAVQGSGAAEAVAATRCASYVSSYMMMHGLISDNELDNISTMSQVLDSYMQQYPTPENYRIGALLIQDMNNRFSCGVGMDRELLTALAQSYAGYPASASNPN